MKESPLFSRSYDFACWLIPQTTKFPREQRFVLATRLQGSILDFMNSLYAATTYRDENRRKHLKHADVLLKQCRFYLRMSYDLKLLSTRRYEYASRKIEEMGRLLGAWILKCAVPEGSPH